MSHSKPGPAPVPSNASANAALRVVMGLVRLIPGGRRGRDTKHVLVIRRGNVGDTVVALPAFHALRKRFPEARLTLLTSPTRRGAPGAREVLEGDDTFDDLWMYYADESQQPTFLREMRRKIREAGVDLAVTLPNQNASFESLAKFAALLVSAGVRRVEGLSLVERGKHTQPQVERLAAQLAPLGAGKIEALPWLHPAPEAETQADELLAEVNGSPLIGMHCGAARPANQWFAERYAELARRLIDETGAAVLLTGGAGEKALTAGIAGAIGAGAHDLAGQCSIAELSAVMRRCALSISNDTGPMHVAYAVGTPVLALFSARYHPHVWYPYGDASRILRAVVECSPCHADVCPIDAHTPCLDAITVDAAYAAAIEMLGMAGLEERRMREENHE